jgi:hypothetical protein
MTEQSPNGYGDTSAHFDGAIGRTVPAADFPERNYLTDMENYDYEGNWGFARFDGDDVLAARFGFGMGGFKWEDWGADASSSNDYLFLQLELMTSEGAVLWLCADHFKAGDCRIGDDSHALTIVENDGTICDINGWPQTTWRMQTLDDYAAVDLTAHMETATIVPDSVLPNNRFAMWIATGSISGTVRWGEHHKSVRGVIFTDHPRITATHHRVAELGWFHYTPMRLDDGSRLIAYFTRFADGGRNPEYCFGCLIRPDGSSVWLQQTAFEHTAFDAHNKPRSWRQTWEAEGLTVTARSSILPLPLNRAWGGDVPQSLKDNTNVPNAFDTEMTVTENGADRRLTGGGIYEYINTGKGHNPQLSL